jgi:hypothetical protein
MRVADGGTDMIGEGAPVGGESGGRSGAVGDESFEPSLPEVEEVVDLVVRAEVAGVVGSGAVQELEEQRGSRGGLGCAGSGDGSDLAVMLAKPGVSQVPDRLAFLVVFRVLVEISPQVPIGSGVLGMCLLHAVRALPVQGMASAEDRRVGEA